jgi:hypothetical protein
LPQQKVGVFVRAALPGTLRIAEVDLHIRSYRKVLVFRHLQSAVPRQRAFQRSREFANMLTQGSNTAPVSLLGTLISMRKRE